MKNISITLLLALMLTGGFAQTTSKEESIKQLLEVTGAGKMGAQVAQSMITSFKETYPYVPEDFWNAFSKEIKPESLAALIVPVYDKYYSEEEIKQLIEFYQTPLGKKLIEQMPLVMQESMQAGQIWGREIAEKVYDNLKAKGHIKKEN